MPASSPCAKVWAPTALSYFTATMSGVVGLIATVGNLLIIVAVIKDPLRKLRTPFMYFLVNLAFSDLVVGCITLPTSVVTHTLEAHGTKKAFHVKIIQLSYFMSSTASILNLAVLGMDRYIAVKSPLIYRKNLSFKVCFCASILIWLVSLALPFLFFVVGYMNYLMIFAHTAVVLTLVIMLFIYLEIYITLRNQRKKMNSYVRKSDVKTPSQGNEKRVTKVFLLILLCVVVCYVPAIVSIYILKFVPDADCVLRHILRDLQFLFIVSNSCINPFVCSIQLKPFKQALLHMMSMKKASRSDSSSGQGEEVTKSELQTVASETNFALHKD